MGHADQRILTCDRENGPSKTHSTSQSWWRGGACCFCFRRFCPSSAFAKLERVVLVAVFRPFVVGLTRATCWTSTQPRHSRSNAMRRI